MSTICCIGDSITAGGSASHGSGYRYYFSSLLPSHTLVGSQTDVNGLKHEGYSGNDIPQIRAAAMAGFVAAQPDLAILMAGTNGTPTAAAIAGLAGALHWYGAYVLVLGIAPKTGVEQTEFNSSISGAIAHLPNASYLYPWTGITYPDDFADTIHPNDDGYELCANAIATELATFPTWSTGQGRGYTGAARTGRGTWFL